MKAFFGAVVAFFLTCTAFAAGLTSVEIDGIQYTNIDKAYLGAGGKVIILFPSGGISPSAEKVPSEFLDSWNIKLEAAKAAETQSAAIQLERAISCGYFREIAGVVYDIRKPQSGWVTFTKAKVIQVLDDGVILDITPDSGDYFGVHVKHLSSTIGDTDTIRFTAKLVGNYSYVNKLDNDRTIREYDVGRVCTRDEIPPTVLSGQKSFDVVAASGSPNKDMLASLPESGDLKASGSGFFITDDGYVISNNHVVKDSTKIRLLTSDGTIDAEIVQVDAANDLALLKTKGKFRSLPIASSRKVQLGATVLSVGFPDVVLQGFSPKLSKGEIASISGIEDDPRYFQISVPVQPGNSGGALVDECGNVVGVVSAKLNASAALASTGALPENVNYAIKSSILLSFLESVPAVSAKTKDPATAVRKFEDVVKSAQDAAVMVLVY